MRTGPLPLTARPLVRRPHHVLLFRIPFDLTIRQNPVRKEEAMRETSPSPVRVDRAHIAPEAPPSRRLMLASEARRLSRRRAVALAVASRCRRMAEFSDARRGASDVAARAM